MIVSMRESKANLSKLVEKAASSKEVLITVRGQPKARLVAAALPQMEGWGEELEELQRTQALPRSLGGSVVEDLRDE